VFAVRISMAMAWSWDSRAACLPCWDTASLGREKENRCQVFVYVGSVRGDVDSESEKSQRRAGGL
jgi:hypothetical protein